MLMPYLKKIVLFGIISILFTGHVSSQPSTKNASSEHLCLDGKIPVFRDIQNRSSFVTCASEEILDYIYSNELNELPRDKFTITAIEEKTYNEFLKHYFNRNKIIEWFVIGFVIVTIMSLPINILWRFRLKIPACLFAIMTALSVIAIPYILG